MNASLKEHKSYNKTTNLLTLFFLSALFLTIRTIFLLSAFYFISNHEELYNGTLAHDFLQNPSLFIKNPNLAFCYQYMPFAGGTFIVSILAIPFFALLGNSVFSLKLLSILISLATFVVFYLLLEKFFSHKTALIFGILLAFSAPYPILTSLILWGNHNESVFFTALLFYLILSYNEYNSDKKRYLILSGLVAGFGFYFDYIFITTILSVIIFLLLSKRNFFFKKDVLYFSISFICGFFLWFYTAFLTNFENLRIHKPGIAADFSIFYLIKKFLKLIIFDLPSSFWLKEIRLMGINILPSIYYLIFLFSFIFLLTSLFKEYINKKKLPNYFLFLLYIILFSLVFTFSKFSTGKAIEGINLFVFPFKIYRDRFFITLFPFIIITVSILLSK
ncbi:MAG: hypothetical protein D6734_06325, partial [Candidatus Schekmanbacteria bacterium]